jgi:hypothetical protein
VLTFASVRRLFAPLEGSLAGGLANTVGFLAAVLVPFVMGLSLSPAGPANRLEFLVVLPFVVIGGTGPFVTPTIRRLIPSDVPRAE